MTGLERALAETDTDSLLDAVRILHIAGRRQRELLAAWGSPSADPREPSFPPLLAAICLELHLALLERHAIHGICPACIFTVESEWPEPPPDPPASVGAERASSEALA